MFLLRTLDSPKMSPLKAAVIWALGYYVLSSLVTWLEYTARGLPVLQALLDPIGMTVVIVQCALAVAVFHKVEDAADDYMSYMLWGGLGLALIFFIIPPLLQQLFMAISGLSF